MYPDRLVFGLVDAPSHAAEPTFTLKLRDLTISWSRYDYRGPILEARTIDDVLDQALELGYRWCLVQAPGHIILEEWRGGAERKRLDECVSQWIGDLDFLALGALLPGEARYELDNQFVLVDLHSYQELGRPAFTGGNFIDASSES